MYNASLYYKLPNFSLTIYDLEKIINLSQKIKKGLEDINKNLDKYSGLIVDVRLNDSSDYRWKYSVHFRSDSENEVYLAFEIMLEVAGRPEYVAGKKALINEQLKKYDLKSKISWGGLGRKIVPITHVAIDYALMRT